MAGPRDSHINHELRTYFSQSKQCYPYFSNSGQGGKALHLTKLWLAQEMLEGTNSAWEMKKCLYTHTKLKYYAYDSVSTNYIIMSTN